MYSQKTRYRSIGFCFKEQGQEWTETARNNALIIVDTDKKMISVNDDILMNFYILRNVELDKKEIAYSFICVDDYDIKCNVIVFIDNDDGYNGLLIEYGNVSYLYIFKVL